jgi:hypothetical protein
MKTWNEFYEEKLSENAAGANILKNAVNKIMPDAWETALSMRDPAARQKIDRLINMSANISRPDDLQYLATQLINIIKGAQAQTNPFLSKGYGHLN